VKLARTLLDVKTLEGKKFRLSKYCHILNRKDKVCLYHSLSLGKAFISKTQFEQLSSFLERPLDINYASKRGYHGFLAELYEKFMLVEANENDDDALTLCQQAIWEKAGIRLMYLIVTEQCNLDCSYCFVEKNYPVEREKKSMNSKIVKSALEYFAAIRSNETGNSQIILYGGEPLLNFPRVKDCVLHVDKLKSDGLLPKSQVLSLLTNGTLVDDSIAKFLYRYGVEVAVSLDGPQNMHDKFRKYADGKGSFQNAYKGAKILSKYYGSKLGISLAITPENVDTLPGIAEWVVKEFGVESIGLSLPTYPLNKVMNLRQIAKKVFKSYLVLREYGIVEERFSRVLEPFYKEMVYPCDCGAIGSQIVVAPDGQVGICHAFLGERTHFVRDVFILKAKKVHPFSISDWQEWRLRSPLTMKECRKCIALGICGGGCGYNALKMKGSIWDMDTDFCQYISTMLRLLLWHTHDSLDTPSNG